MYGCQRRPQSPARVPAGELLHLRSWIAYFGVACCVRLRPSSTISMTLPWNVCLGDVSFEHDSGCCKLLLCPHAIVLLTLNSSLRNGTVPSYSVTVIWSNLGKFLQLGMLANFYSLHWGLGSMFMLTGLSLGRKSGSCLVREGGCRNGRKQKPLRPSCIAVRLSQGRA